MLSFEDLLEFFDESTTPPCGFCGRRMFVMCCEERAKVIEDNWDERVIEHYCEYSK